MTVSGLASLDVPIAHSGRHARAFLPVDRLRSLDVAQLPAAVAARFVEDDDAERLQLLERALSQRAVRVEAYPGEAPPHELHAYVVAPSVAEEPLFGCVLAPLSLVRLLVERPPHLVLETATFQVIDGEVTPATIVAALETWVGRVWPLLAAPVIQVRFWPHVALRPLMVPGLAVARLGASLALTESRGRDQSGLAQLRSVPLTGTEARWTGTR